MPRSAIGAGTRAEFVDRGLRSRVQVVYNPGREEPGTREALERLAASVARHQELRARGASSYQYLNGYGISSDTLAG
jgi:hypothetical protein